MVRFTQFVVAAAVVTAAGLGSAGCTSSDNADTPASSSAQSATPSITDTQRDAAFLISLQKLGISPSVNQTPAQTLELAKQGCRDANTGTSATEVVGRMSTSLPILNIIDVSRFVGAAVKAFCPQNDQRFRKELSGG